MTAALCDPATVAHLDDPVDPRVGLVLRFDDPDVHDRGDGRRQRTLRGWAVGDLVALGADAVWLTVWWHPDAGRPVRHGQEKFAEIVGHDADHHQLPFIVEPSVDERPAADDSTPERELAIARHAVGRFADPRFGAELVAVPCPPEPVAAGVAPDVLHRHFTQIDQLVGRAWILSTHDERSTAFTDAAEVAMACGAVGTAAAAG